MGCCVGCFAFWPPDNEDDYKRLEQNSAQFLHKTKTTLGNTIVIFYYPIIGAKYTVLYSHGNAENIATSEYQFRRLASTMQCNMCAYDYSGYGGSTGSHSEKATYDDIRSVYNWLQTSQGKSKDSIILFGRSLGSGPTIDLASKERGLKALILQSPLRSAMRTTLPEWAANMGKVIDIYQNENKIKSINDYPVYIIHGTVDQVVPFSHGQWLYQQFKIFNKCGVECFWVKGCGHNNIDAKQTEFNTRMKKFLNVYVFNDDDSDGTDENKDEKDEKDANDEKQEKKEKANKNGHNENLANKDNQNDKDTNIGNKDANDDRLEISDAKDKNNSTSADIR